MSNVPLEYFAIEYSNSSGLFENCRDTPYMGVTFAKSMFFPPKCRQITANPSAGDGT